MKHYMLQKYFLESEGNITYRRKGSNISRGYSTNPDFHLLSPLSHMNKYLNCTVLLCGIFSRSSFL